jgi:MFS transporter, FHS family, Na+ dependent glucose transporter 1
MKKSSLFENIDPRDRKRLLTYAISYFSVGIGVSSLGPLLPFLADNVNVSLGQISFVFTAQNLGYLLGSMGGGWLYDRFKSHNLMVLSLTLMVLAGLLIPMMSWFVYLLLVLFFFGLGVGTLDVGENLSLVWIVKSRVVPYLNALHFIFGMGAFFTPLIISTVMAWTGGNLTWAIWVLVLLFCPGLIGLLLLESPVSIPVDEGDAGHQAHNYGLIGMLILIFFLAVGIQIGFGGWIFTYVSDQGIADVNAASLMTSIFWGCLTLGRLVAIPVSKKATPVAMLRFNFALLVLVMGLILTWPMNPAMMWVGSAGMGLATSILFPTLLSFAKTRLHLTGRVTGLFFMGSSLGMMVLPLLLGQVYENWGGYQMLLVLFTAALVALGMMVLLGRKHLTTQPKVLG